MIGSQKIYKRDTCGNIIRLVHAGDGDTVCCGDKMKLSEEKIVDDGEEKDVPMFETAGDGIKERAGRNPNPTEEKYYIEWI